MVIRPPTRANQDRLFARSNHRVLWLGSGFSHCATKGQLPLMQGFFDRLDAKEYPALLSFLRSLGECPYSADVECVLTQLDELEDAPLRGEAAVAIGRDYDFGQIRTELTTYCIRRLCVDELDGDHWVVGFLARIGASATIVTTNYDNIGELILSNVPGLRHRVPGTNCPHCKMCAILEADCACDAVIPVSEEEWRGAILKLHGSIAWMIFRNPECVAFECLLPDAHCRPLMAHSCRCCGAVSEPVLIMPSAGKRYARFPNIHRMWDGACKALLDAEDIVIFGYSLPRTDVGITRLLEDSLRKNKRLRRVLLVDKSPEAVRERLGRLLPVDRTVDVELLHEPDGRIPDWWLSEVGHDLHS